MAAPTYQNGTQPVLSDAGTVTSPSDTAIGDLVIIVVWSQGTGAPASPAHAIQGGYTEIRSHSHNDGSTDGRLSCAYKVATAAGAQSYTPYSVTGATAGQTAVGCIVIAKDTYSLLTTFPQNSSTQTGNAVPDPVSITGLYGDYLVLAIAAWHITTAGSTTTGPPASYTERLDAPAGSHVTHLAVATRALTGLSNATEDPANFTDNVTPNGSATMTIGVAMIIGGTTTATLAALTDTTDSDTLIAGTTAATLAALTDTTDGDTIAGGTSNVQLAECGITADGTLGSLEITGDLAVTLDALVVSGAAGVDVVGAAAVTLDALPLSGAAGVEVAGTSNVQLDALPVSGDADAEVSGTTATSLDSLALSSAAGADVVAALDTLLAELTVDGEGILDTIHVGTLAATLGALTLSAGGSVTDPIRDPGAVRLRSIYERPKRAIGLWHAPPSRNSRRPKRG